MPWNVNELEVLSSLWYFKPFKETELFKRKHDQAVNNKEWLSDFKKKKK